MSEKVEGINPERIRWCCDDHRITPEGLSKATKIGLATLDKAMNGVPSLTFNQLQTLAEYFGRGILFFFEQAPVVPERVHSPQFRTLANRSPDISHKLRRLIKHAELHREIYLALTEDAEDDRPRFAPPVNLPTNAPKACSEIVRDWLALGDENDFDRYRAAVQSKGILVFKSSPYAGPWQIEKDSEVSGFSLYYDDAPVIVVRKERSPERQAFTLMHELGHLLLHRDSFLDDDTDILQNHTGREGAANRFAGHLLVPDTFLDRINDRDRPSDVTAYDEWLEPFKKAWGVSGQAILIRLQEAGRIKSPSVRDYFAFKKRGSQENATRNDTEEGMRWRHREPLHIFGMPYVRAVLSAFDAERIPLSKASRFLDNVSIKDVHKLENHCVPS